MLAVRDKTKQNKSEILTFLNNILKIWTDRPDFQTGHFGATIIGSQYSQGHGATADAGEYSASYQAASGRASGRKEIMPY
jgi:hypothetical protein